MKTRFPVGVFVLVVVLIGFAAHAQAQTQSQVQDWKGFYIGLHAGYGWGEKYWFEKANPANLADHEPSSLIGGLQGGYNFQFDQFLVGIEGEVALANMEDQSPSTLFPGYTKHSDVNAVGTITGRAGFNFSGILPYVKVGFAWSDDEYTIKLNGLDWASASESRTGWTVGAGVEYLISATWSVKLEYNYFNMGDENVTFTPNDGSPTEIWNVEQKFNIIKVGFNYQF